MKKKDCFLIDINTPIDDSSLAKIRDLIEMDALRFFKIYNGRKKLVICVREDKIEEFLNETNLLVRTEIPIDLQKETVHEITSETFHEEFLS